MTEDDKPNPDIGEAGQAPLTDGEAKHADSLARIQADSSEVPLDPDTVTEDEQNSLRIERQRVLEEKRLAQKIARRKAEIRGLKQDIKQRKLYANRIFSLVATWLSGILVLLLLSGFSPLSFSLSERVLLAAIGGTTINVLGLFAIVANYLFPKTSPSDLAKTKRKRKI